MRDTRKPDVAMPVEASPAPGGSGLSLLDLAQFQGFTPGPWHYPGTGLRVGGPDRLCVIEYFAQGERAPDVRIANLTLAAAAPALLAECRRLRAEVERMSVALDACTKASWWSQRDNPDAEEMANRLHRVLAACREVYLARRADERESVRLVSDSGWKKEVR